MGVGGARVPPGRASRASSTSGPTAGDGFPIIPRGSGMTEREGEASGERFGMWVASRVPTRGTEVPQRGRGGCREGQSSSGIRVWVIVVVFVVGIVIIGVIVVVFVIGVWVLVFGVEAFE